MSLISNKTIEQINALQLSEVIGRYVDIKKKGSNYVGLSPFSDEKTGSFNVNDTKNIWKDFSSGKTGKNSISFVMELNQLSYPDAIKEIANKFSIIVEYEKESEAIKEENEEKKKLLNILDKTKEIFKKNYNELPLEHWVNIQLIDREFKQETIKKFNIGYAPKNNLLSNYFKNNREETLSIGLILIGKNNEYYDFFRDRLIFPIENENGKTVGFGGRYSPESQEKKQAKYLNSIDSPIYEKSKILYGLNLAKHKIAKENFVFLVEGYTDVMRMHEYGLENTVAPCGTSLTNEQIILLKKYTKNICLFTDNDRAGINAATKDLKILLENGFRVTIVAQDESKEKQDPDSIIKKLGNTAPDYIKNKIEDAVFYILKKEYKEYLNEAKIEREIFEAEYFQEHGKKAKKKNISISPANKVELGKTIYNLLNNISDPIYKERYLEEVTVRFPFKISEIKKIFEQKELELHEEKSKKWNYSELDDYQMPENCNCTIEDVIDDVKKYGMFQNSNRIFFISGTKAPYYFYDVSNFSIEIVQHMQDEKNPMKLIRMCNIHNNEKIFDVLSDRINTLQQFKNVITGYGNFFFSGDSSNHETLLQYLFDKMGNGRKIDILGWQPEGFWVWNNKIVIPDENNLLDINTEGLFKYNGESYYIPSANKMYQKNEFKYAPQKKFKSIDTKTSTANYLLQMYKVHRKHAITGILFAISSLFQDIIVKETSFFPILFYFGPASTGKDNLAEAIQSFVGKPQSAINLEGGVSTMKAQVRELAQFSNGISQFSEYKRGNAQVDGIFKGFWDRNGYKRGNLESHVATDEVPILSSIILTGNDYPDAEALITRLIWEEMSLQEFNDIQKQEYDKLKDIVKNGVSSISNSFILKRKYFEENFLIHYRSNRKLLNDLNEFQNTTSRILDNLSVIFSAYTLFQDENIFPFNKTELLEHFKNIVENQKRKLSTASPFNKFWECFVASMRGNVTEQNRVNVDLRIDGGQIMFNLGIVYSKIKIIWLKLYQEAAPDARKMKEILIDDSSFIESDSKKRVDKNGNPTNAIVFDLSKLSVKEEILHNMNVQLNKGTIFESNKADDDKNNQSESPY